MLIHLSFFILCKFYLFFVFFFWFDHYYFSWLFYISKTAVKVFRGKIITQNPMACASVVHGWKVVLPKADIEFMAKTQLNLDPTPIPIIKKPMKSKQLTGYKKLVMNVSSETCAKSLQKIVFEIMQSKPSAKKSFILKSVRTLVQNGYLKPLKHGSRFVFFFQFLSFCFNLF